MVYLLIPIHVCNVLQGLYSEEAESYWTAIASIIADGHAGKYDGMRGECLTAVK